MSDTRTLRHCSIAARRIVCLLSLLAFILFAGCSASFPFLRDEAPCTLPVQLSKADLVRRLNDNVARVTAWKSDDVRIQARGLPVKLSAHIAVESPQRFRLMARSIMGYEADLGSNDDRFWFWMRRGQPKHVYFARHTDVPQLAQWLNLPFRPDWVMDAMGVVPIDENAVTLEPRDPQTGVYRLVSRQQAAGGRVFRRVIVVDGCYGRIVEHLLQDETGRTIARAQLSDHRIDTNTGATLPHRITLEWPEVGSSMTLTIGRIDVNPPAAQPRVWEMPQYDDYSPFNLARQIGRRRAPGRQPWNSAEAAPAGSGDPSRPAFADELPQQAPRGTTIVEPPQWSGR